jgi:PhnB protein
MKAVTSYLHFNGNCRQAMSFYQQCLGAKLDINTYPDATGQPATAADARIMHSQLSHGSTAFLMASDAPPGDTTGQVGTNFSIALECDSAEEIDRLFAAVAQNGRVTMPLGDVPWGARFGMLTDQFGIQWMFNYTLPPRS